MSIWEKMQDIDTRILYLLMWVVVLWPIISPLNLPLGMQKGSREYLDCMNDIKPGSNVIVSYDMSFSGLPELGPMSVATLHKLLEMDVKIYLCAFWNAGADIAQDDIELLKPEENYGKVYGVDYIHLGYNPMSEVGMTQFASDVYKAFPVDFVYGKPLDTYEIMDGIHGAEEFDMLISIQSGTPGNPEWIRQWIEPYGIDYIIGVLGVSVPGVAPYYNAGQVMAYLAGVRSAAEFEILVGRPDVALAQQDPLSTTHLLVIVFVILGNIGHFYTRREKMRSYT